MTPHGVGDGALKVSHGRIAAIRRSVPRGARRVTVHGAYLAPGFIDLHVWGPPEVVARDAARAGATAFLTTLGPEPPRELLRHVAERAHAQPREGAACVGLHLEGPFVNPSRGGALPKRWMRAPTVHELTQLARAASGRLKLITMAPELRGAGKAIRWCRRHHVQVSLGHSDADGAAALRAVRAGASAVTHVFNGMRPLHHRQSALIDIALTEPRLTTMVIADGVHVSSAALRLLVRTKSADRIALVTDSIRHQGWDVVTRDGAYYLPAPRRRAGQAGTRAGVLAGSRLTMIRAVRNMVRFGGVSLTDAVRMASEVPARLLGMASRGALAVGKRADLVAFDRHFRVLLTIVGGRVVHPR